MNLKKYLPPFTVRESLPDFIVRLGRIPSIPTSVHEKTENIEGKTGEYPIKEKIHSFYILSILFTSISSHRVRNRLQTIGDKIECFEDQVDQKLGGPQKQYSSDWSYAKNKEESQKSLVLNNLSRVGHHIKEELYAFLKTHLQIISYRIFRTKTKGWTYAWRSPFSYIAVLSFLLFQLSCASLSGKKRILTGLSAGATAGSVSGAILSPNDESKGLNALVFGLSGALIGGGIAILTEKEPAADATTLSLKEQEKLLESTSREFPLMPSQDLPPFIRDRLKPVVIEEYTETDTISEDGTLHAPHKVYRIKQSGELIANPLPKKEKAK